ncbi:ictacalcin-like [Clupea harengus]|uniref:Protein S100 n=1 Tax=Clupea harengus TaxID=7950 RepID=A0A6P3VJB2_CLUHA|nr:ictacalcin-like [Clupea harengus]
MSRLFGAMATLIEVFREHAGKDGDASTLSKSEVKSLLTKEFGAKLDSAKDKGAVDEMFKALDANADGTVDFTEFVTMVAALTVMMQGS